MLFDRQSYQSHYSVPTWGSNPWLPTWKLITLSTRAKIGVTAHGRCTSDVGALEAYSDTPAWFSTVTDHRAALEVWAHNLWEHTFTYGMLFDRQSYQSHYSVPTWGSNPQLPTWKLITLSTRAKIGVTAHGRCTSDIGSVFCLLLGLSFRKKAQCSHYQKILLSYFILWFGSVFFKHGFIRIFPQKDY